MEMFLILLCMSFFGLAVAALGFKATAPSEPTAEPVQAALPEVKAIPERFFADRTVPAIPPHAHVPIEVLLQQIENHVRMEQAAAESFVRIPTHAHLHTKTSSPLVN